MANPVRQLFREEPAAARVVLIDLNGDPYKAEGGSGGTPGGSTGDIQFNDAGAFGGLTGVDLTIIIPGVATLTFTKGILTSVT